MVETTTTTTPSGKGRRAKTVDEWTNNGRSVCVCVGGEEGTSKLGGKERQGDRKDCQTLQTEAVMGADVDTMVIGDCAKCPTAANC